LGSSLQRRLRIVRRCRGFAGRCCHYRSLRKRVGGGLDSLESEAEMAIPVPISRPLRRDHGSLQPAALRENQVAIRREQWFGQHRFDGRALLDRGRIQRSNQICPYYAPGRRQRAYLRKLGARKRLRSKRKRLLKFRVEPRTGGEP